MASSIFKRENFREKIYQKKTFFWKFFFLLQRNNLLFIFEFQKWKHRVNAWKKNRFEKNKKTPPFPFFQKKIFCMYFPDVLARNFGVKIFFYFFMQKPNEFNFFFKIIFFKKIKKKFFLKVFFFLPKMDWPVGFPVKFQKFNSSWTG